MLVSRRQFLKSSMLVAPTLAFMPTVFKHAVAAATSESFGVRQTNAPGTLVVVQMAGGNDGLNTLVPYADNRYYDLRGTLALPQGSVLPLDNEVGLHPSMAKLKDLWDEGNLAIVEGVGYPNPSFSHFESMDIWQSADLDGNFKEGWLGRYFEGLQATQSEPFQGMAVGRELPLALRSSKVPVPTVQSVARYQLAGDPRFPDATQDRAQAVLNLFAASPPGAPYSVLLDNTMDAAYRSSVALQNAHAAYQPGAVYPETPLAEALKLLAEAITNDLGVKVGHVSIGGFDTHAAQPDDHAALLTETSEAMAAFYEDLKAHGRDGDVVIMTWSEFGRRVTSNASDGTDHGTAGPMFFLGTPIKGGLYGGRPGLSELGDGNLRFTTDFRSVYATVFEQILGVPSEAMLGTRYEPLPLLGL
jgi:uncharacterized protein (DUF1501 family)